MKLEISSGRAPASSIRKDLQYAGESCINPPRVSRAVGVSPNDVSRAEGGYPSQARRRFEQANNTSRRSCLEACSTFTRVTACRLAESPSDPSVSKAPTVSFPPPPLRLLPAGATQVPGGICTHRRTTPLHGARNACPLRRWMENGRNDRPVRSPDNAEHTPVTRRGFLFGYASSRVSDAPSVSRSPRSRPGRRCVSTPASRG